MEQQTSAREMIAAAWQIMGARDWEAALREWRLIMDRFPDNPSGFAGAAAAMREAGRVDAAERLLKKVVARFPASSEIATNYGWVAHAQRNWTEAARRWAYVREHFPESPSGYAGGGAALRELGELDEADAVLQQGLHHLPQSTDIAVNYAWVAHDRRDWPEALRRWEIVRSRFPTIPSQYLGTAAALSNLGHAAEADELLAKGIQQWPSRVDLAMRYARSAEDRQDWSEATCRWQATLDRFPDNATAQSALASAVGKLSTTEHRESSPGGGARRARSSNGRRRIS